MDKAAADTILSEIAKSGNPKRIGTSVFRTGVLKKLSRDPLLQEDGSIALAEIILTEALPDTQFFCGIYEVDVQGIWYFDGDGDINAPVWRQRFIPWEYIKTLTLHRAN